MNLRNHGQFDRYMAYLERNHLGFWYTDDVERWHEKISQLRDVSRYQRALCDELGLEITPPTSSEKATKLLKTFGKLTLRGAVVAGKAIDKWSEPEKPKRRRKHKQRN